MKRLRRMKIIIDTREQLEYSFTVPSERGDLYTGDYSIVGLEKHVAIERKTIPDLIGCLTSSGRDRFERELCRGRGLDFFAVVVEGKLQDITTGNYRSKMHPNAAYNSILAFIVRYKFPLFFVENRKRGAELVEQLLKKCSTEILKRAKRIDRGIE